MATKKKINPELITEDDLKPENIKVLMSIRLSSDLIQGYRDAAEKLGISYQTLMQMKLREGLNASLEKRVEAIEQKLRRA